MAEKQTPLMRQYAQIKSKYPDTILLFRLGDFFETFESDAVITAKVCGITLTKRHNGSANDVPLAGFPHHQLDNYLPKLVRAGYRVAVCEQLEDPKHARGIVRRDVVEVVTPGVALNDKLLDARRNTYVAAIALASERSTSGVVGVSCADVSTGEFFTTEVNHQHLGALLETLQPAEILLSKRTMEAALLLIRAAFPAGSEPAITRLEPWIFEEQFGRDTLLRHFQTPNLKGFGIDELSVGVAAAGVVLHYVQESYKGQVAHIQRVSFFNPHEYMMLDAATKRNLEITLNLHDASREGTLISILDKTQTPMGSRLLKKWITRPLRSLERILQRQRAVEALVVADSMLRALRAELAHMGDIERLVAKASTGRATPRDLVALARTLARLPYVQSLLQACCADMIQECLHNMQDTTHVAQRIMAALVEEPSVQLGSGGIFREGYAPEIDALLHVISSGKSWMVEYQEKERSAAGIPSLKIGYTGVFGYYIEISHAHRSKVPKHYQRKQTLAGAERYTTPELKEVEARIVSAEEQLAEVEREVFHRLRMEITTHAGAIQQNAAIIATLDCLQSLAQAASEYSYVRPELDESDVLLIEDGRHPVVERFLPIGEHYVPNTTQMDTHSAQIHIITGPNMSGKSCYLRQVGLIALLAHIGSFVPAKRARIGMIDRIFTRVGAQDNISAGESTFLVEMQEAANIINNATARSLILLDEVGRGTATFDGIAIAWAIAEYVHEHIHAKTLFATHYHEITAIAEHLPKVRNYKADVREVGATVLFTHRIVEGTANHSFGIHVAEMAGLPKKLTERARMILRVLEGEKQQEIQCVQASNIFSHTVVEHPSTRDGIQFSLFEMRDDRIRERLRSIDINTLTPLQALTVLAELRAIVDEC
ncbi:MAG: DNA mismatch repair protein MutS [Bacteroidota bacterium]|nr:DNA mismatch repair protein MutS [Candidatus Kapabacteria bacterium]MDW8219229.1 DNA mismatch repair protein MutS [Bacteroidota bacterium]